LCSATITPSVGLPVFIGANRILETRNKSLIARRPALFVPQPLNSMKHITLILASAATAIALSNCAAPVGPNTQRGAATGGLAGAALGGIIGHQSGRALEGAALGAAAGGTAGALYGNARDQEQYQYRGY
jgi:5'-3' exoribonuclease 2